MIGGDPAAVSGCGCAAAAADAGVAIGRALEEGFEAGGPQSARAVEAVTGPGVAAEEAASFERAWALSTICCYFGHSEILSEG